MQSQRPLGCQGRRGWVRFHEKGGKEHEVPCHHNLEKYLDEYIAAAGIARDPDGPLFRTAAGKTGELTCNPMWQQDAYRMIQRRAAAAVKTRIGNHTFRTAGITAYLILKTKERLRPRRTSPIMKARFGCRRVCRRCEGSI
jgi:integrase